MLVAFQLHEITFHSEMQTNFLFLDCGESFVLTLDFGVGDLLLIGKGCSQVFKSIAKTPIPLLFPERMNKLTQ